jgi:hypothetical protein
VLNLLTGATVIHPPHLPTLGVILELLLLGGWLEEPGWSGYALPEMQKRHANRQNGALLAALQVGVFRAIWHLPLFIYGHIPWFDVVVFSISFQLIIAWLFNRSGGSVLVVMWFHLASNVFFSAISSSFTGVEWIRYYILFITLQTMIAFGILWISRRQLGVNDTQKKLASVEQRAA